MVERLGKARVAAISLFVSLGVCWMSALNAETPFATPDQETMQRISTLSGKAGKLYYQGKYAEAIALAENALSVAKKAYGTKSAVLISLLDLLADLHAKQGNFAKAITVRQQAVAILEHISEQEASYYVVSKVHTRAYELSEIAKLNAKLNGQIKRPPGKSH